MAGHLPIPTNNFHKGLFEVCKLYTPLREGKDFDRVRVEGYGGYFQKLPIDYAMDDEHGMLDTEVYSFVPDDENSDEIYEIHLGRDEKNLLKINQIYLVM